MARYGTFRVLKGPDQDQEFVLADGMVFGRGEDCRGHLSDGEVSREHFRIEVKGSDVLLVDTGSSNGTLVNTRQVATAVLRTGDKIEVGDTVLVYLASGIRRLPRPRTLALVVGIVLVVAAVVLVVGSGARRRRERIDRIRTWARTLESQKSYRSALAQYQLLQRIDTDAGAAADVERVSGKLRIQEDLDRAARCAETGDYDRALLLLDTLMMSYRDDEDVSSAWLTLQRNRLAYSAVAGARRLAGQGEFDSALALLDSAWLSSGDEEVKAEAARVFVQEGYHQWMSGGVEPARAAFQKALDRDPASEDAQLALREIAAADVAPLRTSARRPSRPRPEEPRRQTPAARQPVAAAAADSAAQTSPLARAGVAPQFRARAESAYWDGYQVLRDDYDTATAVARFQEVCRLIPDPADHLYLKASEKLSALSATVPDRTQAPEEYAAAAPGGQEHPRTRQEPDVPTREPVERETGRTETSAGEQEAVESSSQPQLEEQEVPTEPQRGEPDPAAAELKPEDDEEAGTGESKPGEVSEDAQQKASKLYWDAYQAVRYDGDTTGAVAKFRKVREMVPDPDNFLNEKSTEWLKRLGML